jgi:hypothetical protein
LCQKIQNQTAGKKTKKTCAQKSWSKNVGKIDSDPFHQHILSSFWVDFLALKKHIQFVIREKLQKTFAQESFL